MLIEGNNAMATGQYGQVAKTNQEPEIVKRPIKEKDLGIKTPDKTAKPSEDEIIQAIEMANKKFEVYNTRVEFSIHEKTHEIMIKVFKNDEVIREIPPEKILDMVAMMMEMAGILVDEKA